MNEAEAIRVLNEFRKNYRGRLSGETLDRFSWGNMDFETKLAISGLIDTAQSDAYNYVLGTRR